MDILGLLISFFKGGIMDNILKPLTGSVETDYCMRVPHKTEFDDIVAMDVKLTLGQLINLFLRGYDDKIYIDVTIIKYVDGIRCEDELEDVRIISEWLEPYYDYKIVALSDSNNSLLSVTLKEDL